MAATRRLKELTSATLARLELPWNPEVVVALSGGADSATLAYLCLESGRQTRALHINHQLPASARLEKAATAIAMRLGIKLDRLQVTLGDGGSPEARARDARYAALADDEGPILTGHTRDDLVETMVLNLVRGTGAAGLAGIPHFRPPHVYRPLLAVTRSETREIATLASLPFFDDPMNEDMSLSRSRIRRDILPLMRDLNPAIDAAMARTAKNLRSDTEYLDQLAAAFGSGSLPVSVVSTLPTPLADRLLRNALVAAGISPTADRIERMWSVVSGESNRQDLAEGRSIKRERALLVIDQATR